MTIDSTRPAPLIAVLAGNHVGDRAAVHRVYLEAVWQAGGQPVIIACPSERAHFDRALGLLDRCDAMLATGGGDVDPSRYGEQPQVDLMDVDPVRDAWEFEAIPYWLERGRPLLGICRGLQVLTVVTGGKLHQDLPTAGYNNHWMADRSHEPVHGVRVTPGSLAERALGGRNKVNSIHHQAVKELGEGLMPTAWSDDDVIEAVEAADGSPVVGLQWHPERLACPPHAADADPRHLAIFEWLVETADRAGCPV